MEMWCEECSNSCSVSCCEATRGEVTNSYSVSYCVVHCYEATNSCSERCCEVMSSVSYLDGCHPCFLHLDGVLVHYQGQRERELPPSWLSLLMNVDFFFP